jgi:hypothetical protein
MFGSHPFSLLKGWQPPSPPSGEGEEAAPFPIPLDPPLGEEGDREGGRSNPLIPKGEGEGVWEGMKLGQTFYLFSLLKGWFSHFM